MKKSLLLLTTVLTLGVASPALAQEIPTDVNELTELRSNQHKQNEPVELFSGEWIVGEDLNAGRYKITVAEGQSGNFFVYGDESQEYADINIILANSNMGMGVPEAHYDLINGQVIEIRGMDNVLFESVESEFKTELKTGNWLVGADVKPGKYIATTAEDTSGNLFVYEAGEYPEGYPKVNEILGKGEYNIGTERAQLKLEEGQMIVIYGITTLFLD